MVNPGEPPNPHDDEEMRLSSPDLSGRLFRTLIESFRREPDLKSFLNRLSEASFSYLKLCQQASALNSKGFLDHETTPAVLGISPPIGTDIIEVGAGLQEVPDTVLLRMAGSSGLISTHVRLRDLEEHLKSRLADWTVEKAGTLEREQREQTVALLLHLLKRRRG